VIGAVLSIVYFPFWFVEIRRPQSRALTIVDAVSQSVVERGAAAIYSSGSAAPWRRSRCHRLAAAGLPELRLDLPVEPEHVIFYCGSCHRAWRIRGTS